MFLGRRFGKYGVRFSNALSCRVQLSGHQLGSAQKTIAISDLAVRGAELLRL